MTTILIGTTNPDKLREMTFVLRDLPVTLRPLGLHPDLPAPEEDGETYLANARLKATYYARLTGWPTVGEDSGFEVDALGGEPGVRSARFLGPEATYPERFAEIYRRVAAGAAKTRTARFVCALVLATPDRVVFETTQTVEGVLAPQPRGSRGFGYDPILLVPSLGRTLGELDEAEKSIVSHRGKAVRALRPVLQALDHETPRA